MISRYEKIIGHNMISCHDTISPSHPLPIPSHPPPSAENLTYKIAIPYRRPSDKAGPSPPQPHPPCDYYKMQSTHGLYKCLRSVVTQ